MKNSKLHRRAAVGDMEAIKDYIMDNVLRLSQKAENFGLLAAAFILVERHPENT
ncbi:hypothetical protein Cdeb_02883 [Caldibacillus debilis GB1]|jgi:hypothetical protein|uniref:Uncharacterized protein n=1 Tax=Caldibacillus debilis GB1 TaxID=1339248 RepID=A0A420VJ95_9BACI|nr:hypothetical protein Cdeb_02883 [Caldibacillus debilis GB1]